MDKLSFFTCNDPGLDSEKKRIWWIDITCLRSLFYRPNKPAGIQRVVLEILKEVAFQDDKETCVCLVYFDSKFPGFRTFSWEDVAPIIGGVPQRPHSGHEKSKHSGRYPESGMSSLPNKIDWLPKQFLVRVNRVVKKLFTECCPTWQKENTKSISNNHAWKHPFRNGDVWMNLGGWWDEEIVEAIASIRQVLPVFDSVTLIHDCLPLALPEYTDPDTAARCRDKLTALLVGSTAFLAASENTIADIRSYMLPTVHEIQKIPILKIRFGTSKLEAFEASDSASSVLARYGLKPRNYVLMVGTIENRKNHVLAFKAWRSLYMKYGKSMLDLVFVGRWGLKTVDLRAQLEHCSYVDGRIKLLCDVPDCDLAIIYHMCRFTLFPSIYEGWGLPITESHAYGKVCVTADNSSLLEAGGGLAVHFNSDCLTSLLEALEPLLFDDTALAVHETRLKKNYSPIGWQQTWQDIVRSIDTIQHQTKNDENG